MPSIKGVLQESVLSSVCATEELARRNDLESISNPFKRVAVIALHEVAIHYPEEVGRMISLGQTAGTAEFIAAGFDAVVYKTKHGIIKVHKSSFGKSELEQQDIAELKLTEHKQLYDALGNFVLNQSTSLESHPIFSRIHVVATRQQFVPNIVDTKLFEADHSVRESSLADLQQQNPNVINQLSLFIKRSKSLFQSTSLLPDLWGSCNLVSSAGRLYMIDGQPLDMQRDTEVHAQSLARLHNLETAITT